MSLNRTCRSIARALLLNSLEQILRKPYLARDHILRATSEDGLTWLKDTSFRYRYPYWYRDHMSYYVARDDDGSLWFRTSVRNATGWTTELRSGARAIFASDLALSGFGGMSFCDGMLFVAVRADEQTGSGVMAFRPDLASGWRPVVQFWQSLTSYSAIEDVFVLRAADGWLAWVSAGSGGLDVSIYQFSSKDATCWLFLGRSLPAEIGYCNNPCVTKLSDGRYRMYFRRGDLPAVGNVIASAVSSDCRTWIVEAGNRLTSGGRWDRHGVAFPFVEHSASRPSWTMYYAGFWGDCPEGNAAAIYWQSQGRQA